MRTNLLGQLNNINVKEYFDVSVYRNILTMLQTFEGVLHQFGNDLQNEVVLMYPLRQYGRGGYHSFNGRMFKANENEKFFDNNMGKIAIGYAIKQVGNVNGHAEPFILANKMLKNAKLTPLLPPWNHNATVDLTRYMRKKSYFAMHDLLNMSRNLETEMNRVRLPLPHNFRQLTDKIQGVNYKVAGFQNGKYTAFSKNNFVILMNMISYYMQLKLTIPIIRNAVRKEIDAANLAAKVREETIRAEQEALISREKAKAEAEEKALRILADKKAALTAELESAEQIKLELAETKAELEHEIKLLNEAKNLAVSDSEIEPILQKENELLTALDNINAVEADKEKAINTAVIASTNLNKQLENVEIKNESMVNTSKIDVKPLLLIGLLGTII